MSFKDDLVRKLFPDLSSEGDEDKLPLSVRGKLLSSSFALFNHQYIILNGETVSIYDDNVSFDDIILFFKERMPWLKVILRNGKLFDSDDPAKFLMAKSSLFSELSELLEEASLSFTAAFVRPSLAENPQDH